MGAECARMLCRKSRELFWTSSNSSIILMCASVKKHACVLHGRIRCHVARKVFWLWGPAYRWSYCHRVGNWAWRVCLQTLWEKFRLLQPGLQWHAIDSSSHPSAQYAHIINSLGILETLPKIFWILSCFPKTRDELREFYVGIGILKKYAKRAIVCYILCMKSHAGIITKC